VSLFVIATPCHCEPAKQSPCHCSSLSLRANAKQSIFAPTFNCDILCLQTPWTHSIRPSPFLRGIISHKSSSTIRGSCSNVVRLKNPPQRGGCSANSAQLPNEARWGFFSPSPFRRGTGVR